MAHKRKDTLSEGKLERWKHLRGFGKRQNNHAERRAVNRVIKKLAEPDLPELDEHIFNVDDCGHW